MKVHSWGHFEVMLAKVADYKLQESQIIAFKYAIDLWLIPFGGSHLFCKMLIFFYKYSLCP